VFLIFSRPYDEVISTLENVQLLLDKESLRVYHLIDDKATSLHNILKDNDISLEEQGPVNDALRDFIQLCCVEGSKI
jgi:hypothetical protein